MDLDELISKLQALKVKYPNGDFSLKVESDGISCVSDVWAEDDDFEDARIHARESGRPQIIVTIVGEDT